MPGRTGGSRPYRQIPPQVTTGGAPVAGLHGPGQTPAGQSQPTPTTTVQERIVASLAPSAITAATPLALVAIEHAGEAESG